MPSCVLGRRSGLSMKEHIEPPSPHSARSASPASPIEGGRCGCVAAMHVSAQPRLDRVNGYHGPALSINHWKRGAARARRTGSARQTARPTPPRALSCSRQQLAVLGLSAPSNQAAGRDA